MGRLRRGLDRLGRWVKPRHTRLRLHLADSGLGDLIDPSAGLDRVAGGFGFVEGPVWIAEEQVLLFSDIPNNRILRLTRSGKVTTYREPSHHSNGLTRDPSGRLLACEHGLRRVTRTERDGQTVVLAERYRGKRLNSPNDLVTGPGGAIYFTDPPYGIAQTAQEQPVQGLYLLRPDQTEPDLLVDDFDRPNGLAFSPDCSRLYVADSSIRSHLRAFEVRGDGSLSGGRVFLSMAEAGPGVPDGMKVDAAGNVYSTGPGGIWVIDPTGRHLGTVLLPETAANCAWGGEDWRSLFVTASTSVFRLRVRTPGVPVGPS